MLAVAAGSATIAWSAAASDLRQADHKTCKVDKKVFLEQVQKLAKKDVKTVKVDDKTYTLKSVNWDKLTDKQRAKLQQAVTDAATGKTKAVKAVVPVKGIGADGKWYCGPCGRG